MGQLAKVAFEKALSELFVVLEHALEELLLVLTALLRALVFLVSLRQVVRKGCLLGDEHACRKVGPSAFCSTWSA